MVASRDSWVRYAVAVVAFGVVAWAWHYGTRQSGGIRPVAERRVMPEVEMVQLDGGTWRTVDHRGQVVLVNYWATWCVPCRAEMPRIAAIARTYAATVHFLGVDVEDDVATAERFALERNVGYPMLSDPRGEIRRDQKILGLPVTQFYRADGALAFKDLPSAAAAFDAALAKITA